MSRIENFIVSVIHSDIIPISFLIYFAIIGQAAVTINYDSKVLALIFIITNTIIIFRRIGEIKKMYDALNRAADEAMKGVGSNEGKDE